MANFTKSINRIRTSTVNTEQFIEKCSQPVVYNKSGAMLNVTYQLINYKKPVCTQLGIVNPVKLNLSKNTLDKIKRKGA